MTRPSRPPMLRHGAFPSIVVGHRRPMARPAHAAPRSVTPVLASVSTLAGRSA